MACLISFHSCLADLWLLWESEWEGVAEPLLAGETEEEREAFISADVRIHAGVVERTILIGWWGLVNRCLVVVIG